MTSERTRLSVTVVVTPERGVVAFAGPPSSNRVGATTSILLKKKGQDQVWLLTGGGCLRFLWRKAADVWWWAHDEIYKNKHLVQGGT